MSNKKTKCHGKVNLKGAKPRKSHTHWPESVRRVYHRPLYEMDTTLAIWEAHDDPC